MKSINHNYEFIYGPNSILCNRTLFNMLEHAAKNRFNDPRDYVYDDMLNYFFGGRQSSNYAVLNGCLYKESWIDGKVKKVGEYGTTGCGKKSRLFHYDSAGHYWFTLGQGMDGKRYRKTGHRFFLIEED